MNGSVFCQSDGNGEQRCRARELGLSTIVDFGRLPPGPANAITDVPGVRVGHCTIVQGEGPLVVGKGPVRTGVTAIFPHGGNTFTDKVTAAVHVINGFGKAVGFMQVAECGVLETPILLTNTLSVGRVADALVDYMLQHNPAIGVTTGTVNPVVAECNDGFLNDIRGRHVLPEHVFAALRNAKSGPVAEGAVGAGTGMSAFGWKGGIGTASRLISARPVRRKDGKPSNFVLGALVLSNFGDPYDLTVGGWPVGRYLSPETGGTIGSHAGVRLGRTSDEDEARRQREDDLGPTTETSNGKQGDGSVVVVLATDVPLDSRQLRRIATRAVVGLVRCGSRLAHGSGDYVIAFSTTNRVRHTFCPSIKSPVAAANPSGALHGKTTPNPAVSHVARSSDSDLAQPSFAPLPDDSPLMADLLRAAGEATEEAVLNSMLQAPTIFGRDGHVRRGLPITSLLKVLNHFQSSS